MTTSFRMTELIGVTIGESTRTHLMRAGEWTGDWTHDTWATTLCGLRRHASVLILDWTRGAEIADDDVCIRCRGYVTERDR